MRYNGEYKESVRSSISLAIDKLAMCKIDASNISNIPSDFERTGDINNVKTGISNIKLDDISSEIEGVIKSYEGTEKTTGENLMDILNLGKKWGEMLNDLNRNTATTQKVANIQLKKEQDRIDKDTKEVQERTQASLKNGCVAFYIGTRKMVENAEDFIISRKAQLQAEYIRQMYGASNESKEKYGEYAEEEAQRIEKEAMVKVEKNKTQEYADKLYDEHPELQEIDDKAYAPFKRTGTGYKVIEGTPVVATSAVIMAVAPEAAPVIIPAIVGVNSAGEATEEYLHDKKSNSKEGITQSYKDGEISKEQYDNYEYIWNLTDEEVERLAKNNNLTKEEVEVINKIRNMNEEWTTTENLANANAYGNAVGALDALMAAGGMELYQYNPFGNDLLNRATRVAIDTASAASETPARALIRSIIDEDKDLITAFEDMGGIQAIVTSAIIGFGGSLLGEVIDAKKFKKTEIDGDSNNTKTSGGKIEISKEKTDEYLREKGILWMKKGKNQLENVKIFETDEAFNNYYMNRWGADLEEAKTTAACACGGEVFLRPGSTIENIIHEGNHVIGMVKIGDKKALLDFGINDVKEMRGINEAFTESIALRMAEVEGAGYSGYSYNVGILNEYIDLLNEHGYADIDLYTYFGSDKTLFGEALNEISGDKYFYYNLVNNMDYADGWSYRTTKESKKMDVKMS